MSHTCIFFSSPDALKEPNHCVCRLRARCSSGVIGRTLRLRHATKRHFSELYNLEHSLPSVGLKQLWIGHVFSRFGTSGLQELAEAKEFAAEGGAVGCQRDVPKGAAVLRPTKA